VSVASLQVVEFRRSQTAATCAWKRVWSERWKSSSGIRSPAC